MRITLWLALLALTACGGSSEETANTDSEVQDAPKEQATTGKHMLSVEQELLEQAKGVEDLLNRTAEDRKKAIDEELN